MTNDWSDTFALNSSSIPSTIFHHTDSILKPKGKQTGSVVSNLYQVVFDSVNGIPVPANVLQKASKLNANVGCRLSLSLFDLESAAFVGKTWHSPFAIPVIKSIQGEQDSDSNSEEADDEKSDKIDMLRAHLVGNKLNLKLRNQVILEYLSISAHTFTLH